MTEEEVVICKALDEIRSFLRSFLKDLLGDKIGICRNHITPEQRKNWDKNISNGYAPIDIIDYNYLYHIARKIILPAKSKLNENSTFQSLPGYLKFIGRIKNSVMSHGTGHRISEAEKNTCWENMKEIARMFGELELKSKINKLHRESKIAKEKDRVTLLEEIFRRRDQIQRNDEIIKKSSAIIARLKSEMSDRDEELVRLNRMKQELKTEEDAKKKARE
jgi:hypothetical protein